MSEYIKLKEMPIKKLVLTMSWPIMLSMLIQSLYNIVDSAFVAQISEDALQAVSIAFPIQMLIIAVAVGTGVGINSLLSRRLGANKLDKAKDCCEHGLLLSLLNWSVFLLFGIFFSRMFISAFTSNSAIINMGTSYTSIVCIFSIGTFLQVSAEKISVATGKTMYSMIIQGSGAIVNLILDPIFIFGLFGMPKMGVSGAAIATVIGQLVGMCVGILIIKHKNSNLQINFKKFVFKKDVVKDIYKVGLPSIIMQSIISVMVFGINAILAGVSGVAVSAFGVYYKLQSFIFMPVIGLNNAIISIVGYNYGAKAYQRIFDSIKFASIFVVMLMGIGTILFQIFPEQLLAIFNANKDLIDIGVPTLRIISLSFMFGGISLVVCGMFQAIGMGTKSLIISLGRQFVLLLPLAYIFCTYLGIEYTWYAFVICEVACALLSLIYYFNWKNKVELSMNNT